MLREQSMLGPFALEQQLGPGSGCAVYRALQLEQKRAVALKVFPAPLVTKNWHAKDAFATEAATLKKLVHPNIVRCHGGGIDKEQGFLALELVEGETLAELIRRRAPLPPELVLYYALQICAGLAFAHEQNVCHLDLMPDKVLVTPNDQIKITDFRVDRLRNSLCVSSLKRTIDRVATMSPEVIRDDMPGHKADLYSLGCLMFLMLTGRPPYEGATPDEITQQHVSTAPPRVATIAMNCPVWLDVLVGQLLEKDPLKRPHTAQATLMALNEAHRRMSSGTTVAQHTAGGFSALRMDTNKDEARHALGIKEQKEKVEGPAFYTRVWFLATCLLLLVAFSVWMMLPPSEQALFDRADELMQTGEVDKMRHAKKEYLLPLLDRFPDGEHAQQAREYVDRVDMAAAEQKMRLNTRLGREPRSEGERLYAEAWNYEHFGDRITALEKYEAMVDLLDEEGDDRPYVNLARQRIGDIGRDEKKSDERFEFIESRLDEADKLMQQKNEIKARKICRSVIRLYGENREFRALVERAETMLGGEVGAE